jgi:hypothetical protein
MRSLRFVVAITLLLSALLLAQSTPNFAPQDKIAANYGSLPLTFEINRGQTDEQVKFLSRTNFYSLFLTADEAVLALSSPKLSSQDGKRERSTAPRVLCMKLRNANSDAKVIGIDELSGVSNYFIGNDPAKWRTNVPTYANVKYESIYHGIDLVYYGNQRQMEYDFIVAPGANPRQIGFNVTGANQIRQTAQGDLTFTLRDVEISWQKPVVYQQRNGVRQPIAAHYTITDKNRIGFELANYDVTRPLYIDPVIYSTYLGGSGEDYGQAIAADSAGNVYVTGRTASANFPTMSPYQPANNGTQNTFVTKINPTGSALVYSTYLGGNNSDAGFGIAVDSTDNVYVTGYTGSTNFPTTSNAFQKTLTGTSNAFVTKINSAGSALVYSSYLGGTASDSGIAIAVDSADNAYVAGSTDSINFPTKNPFQGSNAGGYDAFITKINSAGSALVYSTYLGGANSDIASGVAVDTAGDTYVIGNTYSTNFPTVNPLQSANAGQSDIFVAKFNSAGSALVYSTYLGGPQNDFGGGIAADSTGNAYITVTDYTDICNRISCFYNTLVDKINPTGSAFVYGVQVGNDYSSGTGIAIDSLGNAYMVGTQGGDAPDPIYRTFVQKINSSGSAGPATYFRGNSGSQGTGIATDGVGNAYVTGYTNSTTFPTKGPLQSANGGGYDAFVAKIDMGAATKTMLSSSPNPSTKGQEVTFTAVVSSTAGTPPDGETVSFLKGKAVLGTGSLNAGSATFTTSSLPAGTNAIKAEYSGDVNYNSSTSAVVKQVVNKE